MKRILCLLAFAAAAWAQPQSVWTVTFADPTGLACSAGSAVLYGTTGGLFSCQSGVYASAGGGGGTGTVTHTAGALTSSAIVIGNGTADVKVSGVSIDGSNNITGAASISTTGGSTAGTLWMTQGTANTPSANQVGWQAPTSVPASFLFTLPSAPAAGLMHATNATPSVVSVSAVVDADMSGAVGVAHGGTALTTLTAHALYAGNATTAPTAIGPDASTTKALFSAGASADPAFRAIAQADLPTPISAAAATTHVMTAPYEVFYCTTATACSVTLPAPVDPPATYQFCVRMDNNVSATITLAGITNVYYELPAKTGYGTVSAALVSTGAAVTNQVCVMNRDATHYAIWSSTGF